MAIRNRNVFGLMSARGMAVRKMTTMPQKKTMPLLHVPPMREVQGLGQCRHGGGSQGCEARDNMNNSQDLRWSHRPLLALLRKCLFCSRTRYGWNFSVIFYGIILPNSPPHPATLR